MNIEDLEETARLAHLNMGREELAAAFPAFEQMLGFFAAMQETESLGAGEGRLTVGADHFRRDDAGPLPGDEGGRTIYRGAEDWDGRFIVIPNVL